MFVQGIPMKNCGVCKKMWKNFKYENIDYFMSFAYFLEKNIYLC